MEHTNDNVFDVRYNEKLDRLEKEEKRKKAGVLSYIGKNKFIIGVVAAFIFFSWFNLLLIYKFYKIVELFA